jgi:hypothetical protein
LSDLISQIILKFKNFKQKIGFFDLETQYIFKDVYTDWDNLSWKQKERIRPNLMAKLKLAIAGILTIDKKENSVIYSYYEEKDIINLRQHLTELDIIIGHNLLRFDYEILDSYISKRLVNQFKSKTIDTFQLLYEATDQFIGMDNLGKLNLGLSKTQNSIKIPKMWRQGRYDEVREYLKRDLEITAGIFQYALENKQLEYSHKHYGKFLGNRIIEIDWEELLS